MLFTVFFFNDTAPTEIYTLSLHDALPISRPTASCGPMVRNLCMGCGLRVRWAHPTLAHGLPYEGLGRGLCHFGPALALNGCRAAMPVLPRPPTLSPTHGCLT